LRKGVPPRTPLERELVEIWKDLLEIGEFGVTDNFFTVGGHSLLAMQVLARVEAAFAVPLPLHDFLLEPTVETLAQLLERELLAKSSTDIELQRLTDSA
jgi:acyl carrier protein